MNRMPKKPFDETDVVRLSGKFAEQNTNLPEDHLPVDPRAKLASLREERDAAERAVTEAEMASDIIGVQIVKTHITNAIPDAQYATFEYSGEHGAPRLLKITGEDNLTVRDYEEEDFTDPLYTSVRREARNLNYVGTLVKNSTGVITDKTGAGRHQYVVDVRS